MIRDRRFHDIIRTQDVGAYSFHRVELAGRHLLQCGCVKHVINAFHRIADAVVVTNVADIKFQLWIVQGNPHIFLLFFITTKDANFFNIGLQKTIQNSVTERACTAGNHQYFIIEHYLNLVLN
ncbi:hypothetical protein D3C76_1107330 [compost metagenome]